MSLTARLIGSVVLLVGLTALLAWIVAGRVVLRPFAEGVFEAYVDQAVFVAEEIERGVPPERLARRMQLDITIEPRPPPHRPRRREVRDGREILFRPGPRNVVHVQSGPRWIAVHRELDLERPGQRLLGFLIVGAGLLIAAASWVAREATRPVRTATEAMSAIAAGELGHRLTPDGPPELRSVAESFNAMADRVDAMVKADKQLVAGVSHELRTPLARLRLQLELLRDEAADPARLAAMEEDIEALDGLIGELLELSRLELGARPLQLETVDLRELAAEAVAAVDLPDHDVSIEGAGEARADRALVLRAITNLLQNAGRYAPVDTAVTVQVEDRAVTVLDEGPGVPADELPHLFEPFYRAESSRSRQTGGVGLGLMIVRQVARSHGGEVVARNRPAGGLAVRLGLGYPGGPNLEANDGKWSAA